MRYGILGDVHSNLSALRTALKRLEQAGCDAILQVGDVVGYGAAPEACIDLLRDVEAIVVQGNHDAACVGKVDTRCFNPAAREAIDWTREQLDAEALEWLDALPVHLRLEHCEMAHGTFDAPSHFDYLIGVEQGPASLDQLERRIGFCGHSHVPISVMRPKEAPLRTGYSPDDILSLDELSKVVVNVGSVGQPRDEDPRLAYVVFDTDTNRIERHRAEYDIDREATRIRIAGLPTVLADRLYLGL